MWPGIVIIVECWNRAEKGLTYWPTSVSHKCCVQLHCLHKEAYIRQEGVWMVFLPSHIQYVYAALLFQLLFLQVHYPSSSFHQPCISHNKWKYAGLRTAVLSMKGTALRDLSSVQVEFLLPTRERQQLLPCAVQENASYTWWVCVPWF